MIDGPTAAVMCSAILGVGGSIVVALIKLIPQRHAPANVSDDLNHNLRVAGLETRVAVVESKHLDLGQALGELKTEIHGLRAELREIVWPRKRSGE